MKIISLSLVCFFALMLFTSIATAQDQMGKMPPTIRTNGEGIITAKPDRAIIELGVVTQAATSQAATEQNSRQLETVLSALKKLLGANTDIRTTNYTLIPIYRSGPNPEQTITGYTVTNLVRVVLDDLAQLSKVIDTASSVGANRIQSLQFTLRNQQAAQNQALNEASINARTKANTIVSTLGLKFGRILSVTETTQPGVNNQYVNWSINGFIGNGNGVSATPIAPRSIEIRSTVTLTVEVNQ